MPSKLDPHIATIEDWLAVQPQLTALAIVGRLSEKYPDVNPMAVRFTDLHEWVMGLPDFEDKPERSGEKILEAIQMAWMDEHGD